MSDYVLPDELPSQGNVTRLAAHPGLVMFAMVLAGAWLGVPWLIFNGFALRNPTRWRDAATCLALIPACAGWLVAVDTAADALPQMLWTSKYLMLVAPAIQYVAAYKIAIRQTWLAEAHVKAYGKFAQPKPLLWGVAVAFFAYMLADHNQLLFVLLIG